MRVWLVCIVGVAAASLDTEHQRQVEERDHRRLGTCVSTSGVRAQAWHTCVELPGEAPFHWDKKRWQCNAVHDDKKSSDCSYVGGVTSDPPRVMSEYASMVGESGRRNGKKKAAAPTPSLTTGSTYDKLDSAVNEAKQLAKDFTAKQYAATKETEQKKEAAKKQAKVNVKKQVKADKAAAKEKAKVAAITAKKVEKVAVADAAAKKLALSKCDSIIKKGCPNGFTDVTGGTSYSAFGISVRTRHCACMGCKCSHNGQSGEGFTSGFCSWGGTKSRDHCAAYNKYMRVRNNKLSAARNSCKKGGTQQTESIKCPTRQADFPASKRGRCYDKAETVIGSDWWNGYIQGIISTLQKRLAEAKTDKGKRHFRKKIHDARHRARKFFCSSWAYNNRYQQKCPLHWSMPNGHRTMGCGKTDLDCDTWRAELAKAAEKRFGPQMKQLCADKGGVRVDFNGGGKIETKGDRKGGYQPHNYPGIAYIPPRDQPGLSTAEKFFIRDYYDSDGGTDTIGLYPMFGITKASFEGSLLLFADVGCKYSDATYCPRGPSRKKERTECYKTRKLCDPHGSFLPRYSGKSWEHKLKLWEDKLKLAKTNAREADAAVAERQVKGIQKKIKAKSKKRSWPQRYQGLMRITRIKSSQQSTADKSTTLLTGEAVGRYPAHLPITQKGCPSYAQWDDFLRDAVAKKRCEVADRLWGSTKKP